MPEELKKRRNCLVCGTEFIARSGPHKFCSDACKGKWKYIIGATTNETQYKYISGNWGRYFNRLLNHARRGVLTKQDLMDLLEKQGGKCALSGLELTCQLEVGKRFNTNASIDRIVAGGSYDPSNIQLVCSALNGFRRDTSLEEFIWYCEQVTNHQRKEGKFVCHT